MSAEAWDQYIAAVSTGAPIAEQGSLYEQAARSLPDEPHIHCYVDVEVNLSCSACPARCVAICDECGRRTCKNDE